MSRRIVSIDVGIKNLGLCVFDIKDNNIVSLSDWRVLSLMPNDSCTCSGILKSGKPCEKKGKYGSDGNSYCGLHAPTHTTILKKKSAGAVDIVSLGIALKERLDTCLSNKIDCVLIENQISPIANRMKTVQGMIMQYFIMKDISNIVMVSSKNKLKLFAQCSEQKTYKDRKKMGIEMTKCVLEENKWVQELTNFVGTKRDDLADAFLQGLYHLKTKEGLRMQSR